jgi:DNA-binding MarR family transcriptional regulator
MRSESALAPLGLRPRHLVALTVLRDHGEGTQQGLAAALQIDRTNLVGLLNDLETAGLIERRRDVDDRRRHIVELTAAGGTRLREAECALAAAENEVLGALDTAQRELLYQLLQQATAGHVVDCSAAGAADVVA